MLCILHAWLLEGSGSNLWTRSVVRSLCRRGETVHLVCQENHPERYDFIGTAITYGLDGSTRTALSRATPYSGQCVLHKPELGDTLPVFVWDKYEEYARVVPMVDLHTDEIESYVNRNVEVVKRIVEDHGVTVIHANHAVMMPVVAQRIDRALDVPFTVMPHGSDIEYAVRKDPRFLAYAGSALEAARKVFVIGEEMRSRVLDVFAGVPRVADKLSALHLGVDTSEFELIPRAERMKEIRNLLRSLEELPKGKSHAQERTYDRELGRVHTTSQLTQLVQRSSAYDGKRPDASAGTKLEAIPWTTAPTLLFVGRLIAWKGIQSLIAALPPVLAKEPELRVLVVGHGPLREAMEAFVWALRHEDRAMIEAIVDEGRAIDGSAQEDQSLADVKDFYAKLKERGGTEAYFAQARLCVREDSVVFTGYLTHNELQHLFPCCDVGVFPSVVREAGPLVFLEALASGCFPLGTYFGGMAASIDAVGEELPGDVAEIMKLDPANTVEELTRKIPLALAAAPTYRETLSRVARERYDWSSVSEKFMREISAIERSVATR
ncbi:MAG: glycosyltransferase family 4 protein [Gemmatimonadaceae bacterium]